MRLRLLSEYKKKTELWYWYIHTDNEEAAIVLGLTPVHRDSKFPHVFIAQSKGEAFSAADLVKQEGGQAIVTASPR